MQSQDSPCWLGFKSWCTRKMGKPVLQLTVAPSFKPLGETKNGPFRGPTSSLGPKTGPSLIKSEIFTAWYCQGLQGLAKSVSGFSLHSIFSARTLQGSCCLHFIWLASIVVPLHRFELRLALKSLCQDRGGLDSSLRACHRVLGNCFTKRRNNDRYLLERLHQHY